MSEYKTLKELDLKEGDKVLQENGRVFDVKWFNNGERLTCGPIAKRDGLHAVDQYGFQPVDTSEVSQWKIHSRAEQPVDYNDGKWHGWNGGECPVHPETVVEVRFYSYGGDEREAEDFSWDYDGATRIIAFRVIKEHREPREITFDGVLYREVVYQ